MENFKMYTNIHSRRMSPHKPVTQLQAFSTLGNACFTHTLQLLPFLLLFWSKSKTIRYHVIDIYRHLNSQRVHWEKRPYLVT